MPGSLKGNIPVKPRNHVKLIDRLNRQLCTGCYGKQRNTAGLTPSQARKSTTSFRSSDSNSNIRCTNFFPMYLVSSKFFST